MVDDDDDDDDGADADQDADGMYVLLLLYALWDDKQILMVTLEKCINVLKVNAG